VPLEVTVWPHRTEGVGGRRFSSVTDAFEIGPQVRLAYLDGSTELARGWLFSARGSAEMTVRSLAGTDRTYRTYTVTTMPYGPLKIVAADGGYVVPGRIVRARAATAPSS
jgi:hypothetical protein